MVKDAILGSTLELSKCGTGPYSGPGVRIFHTVLKSCKIGYVIDITAAHKGQENLNYLVLYKKVFSHLRLDGSWEVFWRQKCMNVSQTGYLLNLTSVPVFIPCMGIFVWTNE